MDCTICYDTYDNLNLIIWLPCSHSLCKNCYDKLFQSLCPYCRAPIDTLDTLDTLDLLQRNSSNENNETWSTIAGINNFDVITRNNSSNIIHFSPIENITSRRRRIRQRSNSTTTPTTPTTPTTQNIAHNDINALSSSAPLPITVNEPLYDYEIWQEIEVRREERERRRIRSAIARNSQRLRRQANQTNIRTSQDNPSTLITINTINTINNINNQITENTLDSDSFFQLDEDMGLNEKIGSSLLNQGYNDDRNQVIKNNRSNRWSSMNNQRCRYVRR
jgi:hypothetical protein